MKASAPRYADSTAASAKAARTRARILDAAAEVLSRNGFAGTRLAEIAEVAQLQAPTIYYYFSSREQVIEEVFQAGQRQVIDRVAEALDALPETTSAIDRILAAVETHLEVVMTTSRYASASMRYMSQLPDDMHARQLELRREYGRLWRDLFDAAATSGELNPNLDSHGTRMLVLGALNWVPEWWDPDRGRLREVVTSAQELIRGGLERR